MFCLGFFLAAVKCNTAFGKMITQELYNRYCTGGMMEDKFLCLFACP